MSKGTVNIHGKQYKTVALRVSEFREQCPIQDGWSISTHIIENDNEKVIMSAHIVDPDGKIVGVGYAEEYRAASKINKTSALENAETSAIGRALAAVGLGGEEYASAEEVLNAIAQQDQKTLPTPKDDLDPSEDAKMDSSADTQVQSSELKALLKELSDKIGKDEALKWHKATIKNFFKADTIDELTGGDVEKHIYNIKTKLKEKK